MNWFSVSKYVHDNDAGSKRRRSVPADVCRLHEATTKPSTNINQRETVADNEFVILSLENYSYLNYELSLFQNIDQIFVPVIHSVVVLSNYWINPNWVDM